MRAGPEGEQVRENPPWTLGLLEERISFLHVRWPGWEEGSQGQLGATFASPGEVPS